MRFPRFAAGVSSLTSLPFAAAIRSVSSLRGCHVGETARPTCTPRKTLPAPPRGRGGLVDPLVRRNQVDSCTEVFPIRH